MCRRSPPLGWRTGLDDAHTHLKNSAPLSLLLLRLPERNAHTHSKRHQQRIPLRARVVNAISTAKWIAPSRSPSIACASLVPSSHIASAHLRAERQSLIDFGVFAATAFRSCPHIQAHSTGLLPCWCWFAFSSIVAYCQLDDTRRMVAHNCCCCGQCLASMDVH